VQTPRGKRSDAAALAGLGGAGLKLPLASGGSAVSPIQENRCRDLPGACYAVSALASFSCAVLPTCPQGPATCPHSIDWSLLVGLLRCRYVSLTCRCLLAAARIARRQEQAAIRPMAMPATRTLCVCSVARCAQLSAPDLMLCSAVLRCLLVVLVMQTSTSWRDHVQATV
jgi:hypothetical protein